MDIGDWSLTASDNGNADIQINWEEFQLPQTVNNSARQMMARIAQLQRALSGLMTTGGAADAYTVSPTSEPSALSKGWVGIVKFHAANTGASTFKVGSLAAQDLRNDSGGALVAGSIAVNSWHIVIYDTVNGYYRMLSLSSAALAQYVLKAGDTMTGNLIIDRTGIDASVILDSDAGQDRQVRFLSSGTNRWSIQVDTVAEGGSNAGSNLAINRFSDAGAFVDAPIYITRSSGRVDVGKGLGLLGSISPAQITSDQNDYAPTGHEGAVFFLLTTDATRNLTGLQGGYEGRIVVICNANAHSGSFFRIFIPHESGSSSAANRFEGADGDGFNIPPGGALIFRYTNSRWRCINMYVSYASQGGMEAAGDFYEYVAPAVQHYHPGHPKVWSKVTYAAGVPTQEVSYNMTGITDSGVGNLLFTIATDFSGAHWCCQLTVETPDNTIDALADKPMVFMGTQAAGTVQALVAIDDGIAASDGAASVHMVGLGDQ